MKKRIEIQLCDFCESNPKEQVIHIAKEQCVICGKWLCVDNCNGRIKDNYHTTAHLPSLGYQYHFPTICVVCWKTAHEVDDKNITRGIDINGSGSAWAVKLGQFGWMVAREQWRIVESKIIDEIKRLIALAKKQNADKAALAELKRKHEILERKTGQSISAEDLPF